ncbi:hypothetical protein DSO57_1032262 [Entomophthora muscae]|uniref:Uncharacterized protein n=1 Tax=Entomophthora muscae TaxID=34485 RepID=A0ACC2SDC2_9FUNG|nr:hypothetical protein DSO57_1032262 [Entomophthora muscae]
MFREALTELTHAEGASEWAVTAYKDAQLVRLDPVSLNGVYTVNSIELVWDVLVMLLSKQQAQPASKVLNKQVCDPQSNYLATQSQTGKSTQITKSNNMNR